MRLRFKIRSRTVSPAIVHFTEAINAKGHRQICVIAECVLVGVKTAPIWSHTAAAVRRALATLTGMCECGRRYHKQRYVEGYRVMPAGE